MARGVKRAASYDGLKELFKLEVDCTGNPTVYRRNISGNSRFKFKAEWLEVINKKNHSSGYSSVWTSPTFMNGKGYSLYYHIIIMTLYLHRTLNEDEFIDHIDRDRINNNLNNLRIVTARENSQNKKYKEVGYCFTRNTYVTHIKIHNKLRRIGMYSTKEDSQRRYWLAVSMLKHLKTLNSAMEMRVFLDLLEFLQNKEPLAF